MTVFWSRVDDDDDEDSSANMIFDEAAAGIDDEEVFNEPNSDETVEEVVDMPEILEDMASRLDESKSTE